VPHLLLRRAGFPFHLLEGLSCPRTAEAARAAARATVHFEETRRRMLTGLFSQAVQEAAVQKDRRALKTLSRWRKKIGARAAYPLPAGNWPAGLRDAHAEYSAALLRKAELDAAVAESFPAELRQARETLRKASRDSRVREALFLLSPDFFQSAQRSLRSHATADPRSNERAFERRLYLFLQRLASKNETTSFFGPLTHAQVEPQASDFVFGPEMPSGVLQREAFASFWAVCAIARAATLDPHVRTMLPVRRIPASLLDDGRAYGPDGNDVPLDELLIRVLRAVDDVRTVGELAIVSELSPAETEKAVTQLERLGFVRRDLEPLSTTAHPLKNLDMQLAHLGAPGRWRQVLSELASYLRRFETSDLEGRTQVLLEADAFFERVTKKPARRGQGQMYADRTLLFEDCAGDGQPVKFPGALASRMEDALGPVLSLGAAHGALRHRAIRQLAQDVLAQGGGRLRYLAFGRKLEETIAQGALQPLLAPARKFVETLSAHVREASDGRVASLSVETVTKLFGPSQANFCSPDIILWSQPDGGLRFVIGEVHPYVFAWGSQGQFAPDAAALQAAFSKDLSPWGGRERLATVLRRRRHKGLVTDAFPGTFIEVTGRAVDDDARRAAISELWVTNGADGPELQGPQGPLTLYVGEDDHPHLRAFAPPLVDMPPVRLGEHTPRIVVGDVVMQRERWDFGAEALAPLCHAASPDTLFLRVMEARTNHGWPRHVFVGAPSEPKPMCLDLESPFAQIHLQRLARLGKLSVVEMLPDSQGLWLERSNGRYTSEWRMGMVRAR
jgi:hypothetical protein